MRRGITVVLTVLAGVVSAWMAWWYLRRAVTEVRDLQEEAVRLPLSPDICDDPECTICHGGMTHNAKREA